VYNSNAIRAKFKTDEISESIEFLDPRNPILHEKDFPHLLQMLDIFDMFDLVVAQIQRREVLEVIEVLDSVDEVVVQVEFDEGRRETSVYSCDLVVP
jgi:hypothetical protein